MGTEKLRSCVRSVAMGEKRTDAGRAFAGIVIGHRRFQERIQISLELVQSGSSFEGFVETEER